MGMMRKAGMGLGVLAIVGGIAWGLWPDPVQVDLAEVNRGPMQGVILAQGTTRVRDPYIITAPFAGKVIRSPVEIGDAVGAGETIVAEIQPADPALMDARSRAQAEAAVDEAQASVAVAQSNLGQAETELARTKSQLERGRTLAERGTIPRKMLEDIEAAHLTAEQALAAAHSQLEMNRATLVRVRAQLLDPEALLDPSEADSLRGRILAPKTGIVLAVTEESARLVQAGDPLLTIGNLDEMEVELDLLSTDAVKVPANAPAMIERWGGEGTLEARLRRTEPAAFTKVSALGIEEQRVRLHLDVLTPPDERRGLGEGFRVHVRLIIWDEEDLLQVPQAALFRDGDGWAVFIAQEGRARLRSLEVGRQAGGEAEVLEGLAPGDKVIMYPGSAMADGAAIAEREQ